VDPAFFAAPKLLLATDDLHCALAAALGAAAARLDAAEDVVAAARPVARLRLRHERARLLLRVLFRPELLPGSAAAAMSALASAPPAQAPPSRRFSLSAAETFESIAADERTRQGRLFQRWVASAHAAAGLPAFPSVRAIQLFVRIFAQLLVDDYELPARAAAFCADAGSSAGACGPPPAAAPAAASATATAVTPFPARLVSGGEDGAAGATDAAPAPPTREVLLALMREQVERLLLPRLAPLIFCPPPPPALPAAAPGGAASAASPPPLFRTSALRPASVARAGAGAAAPGARAPPQSPAAVGAQLAALASAEDTWRTQSALVRTMTQVAVGVPAKFCVAWAGEAHADIDAAAALEAERRQAKRARDRLPSAEVHTQLQQRSGGGGSSAIRAAGVPVPASGASAHVPLYEANGVGAEMAAAHDVTVAGSSQQPDPGCIAGEATARDDLCIDTAGARTAVPGGAAIALGDVRPAASGSDLCSLQIALPVDTRSTVTFPLSTNRPYAHASALLSQMLGGRRGGGEAAAATDAPQAALPELATSDDAASAGRRDFAWAVPSVMISLLLQAVRAMHAEAKRANAQRRLHEAAKSGTCRIMDAAPGGDATAPPAASAGEGDEIGGMEELFPILVFALAGSDAPFVHRSLSLLESWLGDSGGEPSYYLVSLQAAVTFICLFRCCESPR
jgi:hypothetical protein